MSDPYRLCADVYALPGPVAHREDEYDTRGFDLLRRMQHRHFWYRGRHRFLLHAVRRHAGGPGTSPAPRRAIDLGAGCGGWAAYLHQGQALPLSELAVADSSPLALRLAAECLPPGVRRYRIDLLDLRWHQRWDVAFLLDVLEHIPQQEQALAQVHRALAPGGLLFVTVPALRCLWTWNDEVVGHQRRYSKADFRRLALANGFHLLEARYFLFFLSPLLLAARIHRRPPLDRLSREETWALVEKMHRVPPRAVNALLGAVFALETPLGHYLPFPWGTSLLGVFQKPHRSTADALTPASARQQAG
jgi:SAM-dependent methyltransferase